VDVVGVDPGRCEGITGWLKAQQHTALAGVEINAHAWSSAIVTAASLALSLASPNAHQIEIKPLRNPMQHELVASPIAPVGGRLSALSAPGLGIAVDEEVLRRYVFSGR
jgi:L-alanine-DL-glutamate epimerase-like enolase superfamily enzyme